jgi:hypothetical protein
MDKWRSLLSFVQQLDGLVTLLANYHLVVVEL